MADASSFTGLGGMAMRVALKTALTLVMNTKPIMDYLAAEMYAEETGKPFDKLPANEKTVWTNRVQSVIKAIGRTIGNGKS